MAEITWNGLIIDTEDVDMLVRFSGLGDLDKAIKFDKEVLEHCYDGERPYWEHRLEVHKTARDIAQTMWDNGEIPDAESYNAPVDLRYVITRLDQIEGNLNSLRETLKEHLNQTPKKKGKWD